MITTTAAGRWQCKGNICEDTKDTTTVKEDTEETTISQEDTKEDTTTKSIPMISTLADHSSDVPASTEATVAAYTSSDKDLSTATPTEMTDMITTSNDPYHIEVGRGFMRI